jgi:hypothetical protein
MTDHTFTVVVSDMWTDEELDRLSASTSNEAWGMAWEKWGWPDGMGADVKFTELTTQV